MAEIRLNEVNGTRMAWSLDAGREYTRVFTVHGMDTETFKSGAMYTAIQAAGLSPGQKHPDQRFGPRLIVNRIEAQPAQNAKEDARIVVHYMDISIVHVALSGTLIRETTNWALEDDNDEKTKRWMTIVYRPNGEPGRWIDPDDRLTTDRIQAGTLEAYLPSPIIEFRYIAYHPPLVNLAGKLNKNTWQNGKPFTWLCLDASARMLPGSLTQGHIAGEPIKAWFEHRLSFQWRGYAGDSWVPYVVFTDPATGKPPADVRPNPPGEFYQADAGNGYQRFRTQPAIDFSFLNFIIPLVCPDMESLDPRRPNQ